MTQPARPDSAAPWRGGSVALLTAALALGAHTFAGGVPSGAGVALTVVLAGTAGALCASTASTQATVGLLAVLGGGQLLAHLVLGAAGHAHHSAGTPPLLMMSAHAAAVALGAGLIAAGDRLWRALSLAVRALTLREPRPWPAVAVASRIPDHPLQWTLLLQSSVSHRGPPVGALR